MKMKHDLFCYVKLVLLLPLLLNLVFLDEENKILIKAADVNDDKKNNNDNSVDPETSALCNVNLMDFLPSPYRELSGATCNGVFHRFTFRFFQNEKNITTIIISGQYLEGKGWIGIGFPKDGSTVDSSTMVGFMDEFKKGIAKKYFIDAFNHSLVIPDISHFQLTDVPPLVVLKDDQLYLAFQLTFTTRMYHKTIILAQGSITPIRNQLTMHDNAKSLEVEFSTAVPSKGGGTRKLMKGHGALAVTAFGLIIPAGSIVARYFKHLDPIWYHIHYTVQYIGYVFAILALAAGRILYEHLGHPVPQHRIVGFVLITLTTLQVLAFVLRPKKESTFQRYYHCYHVWLGRIILVLGCFNISMGLRFGHGKMSLKIGYIVFFSCFLIAIIVFEIRKRKFKARDTIVIGNANNDRYESDVDKEKIATTSAYTRMEKGRENET